MFLGLFFVSCNSQKDPKVRVISSQEYKQEISTNNVQIVDVRTPQEYVEGAIEGAVNINIYDADFEVKIQKLDPNKPVYIYCRSGARSQTAANKMVALGFTEIIDLKGGYMNY